MSTTDRGDDGRSPSAQVCSGSQVLIRLSPDAAEAMIIFDNTGELVRVLVALDVFPRLVDMIQFAELADAPTNRRTRRRVPPSEGEGVWPGLVVRKAPGDGDGA